MRGLLFLLAVVLVAGCSAADTRPRPRGFHRLELPAHAYTRFNDPHCPFTFEYPAIGKVLTGRIDSCYVDIEFPTLGCRWHITSRGLAPKGPKGASAAYEDYRRLIYKHTEKASEITEERIVSGAGGGVYFQIYGEVPTSAQFFFTDSSAHAVMTSFYFRTALKNDSLAPVIEYMKADMLHMAKSIQWK